MDPTHGGPDAQLALLVKQIDRELIRTTDGRETLYSGINRQDILIGLLVETLVTGFGLDLSYKQTDRRVRNTIEQMRTESNTGEHDDTDPVSRFRGDFPELTRGSREHRFTVLIPLPLRTKPNCLPRTVYIDGNELTRTDDTTWNNYSEKADTSTPIENSNCPDSVTELVSSLDIPPISQNNYTFWVFTSTGGDADFVLRDVDSVVETFFGQLNFTTHRHSRLEYDAARNRIERLGRTIIEQPPMYLVFRADEFYRLQPKNTRINQPIPKLRREERFDTAMQPFPSLASFDSINTSEFMDEDTVINASTEAQLAACFRTLRKALITSDPETAFLSLYRTLEHVTFKKNGSSKEPLDRALRLIGATTDSHLSDMISILSDRRNKLVHEGTDVGITVNDLNFLKNLSFVAMETLGSAAQSYSRDDIITYITTDVASKLDDLQTEHRALENRIERFRDINEWEHRVE